MPVNDKKAHHKLAEYSAKRRRGDTPEPFAAAGTARPGQFVVHLHAARRRHYDLRLEVDGVLRCWAVPHGPSLDPSVKRLAVQTEDHPVEYLDFEDVIPAGNYGAGAMIVWDRGRWLPRQDDQTGDDKLLFDLYGHKLRGRWTLVRTRRDPREWLLIKKADAFARAEGGGSGTPLPEESVYSGLTVAELAEGVHPHRALRRRLAARGASAGRVPVRTLEPMLARAEPRPFSRPGWLFEIKYDGYRLLCGLDGGEVYLRYRSGGDATHVFPELLPALRRLRCDSAVLDGEVVVLGADGRPDFGRLAARARAGPGDDVDRAAAEHPASYFVFDLLEIDGLDLRRVPLRERKHALERLVPRLGPVRYSEHVEEDGAALFERVRRLGLEGIVAKRADGRYRSGRSGLWLKVRADRSALFTVVGYTRADGDLGALVLAVRDGDAWRCVGRVGSGFGGRQRAALLERLAAAETPDGDPPAGLERPEAAARRRGSRPRDVRWVRPRLAVRVRFKESTRAGILRQAVFERLCAEIDPCDCTAGQPGLGLRAATPVGRKADRGPGAGRSVSPGIGRRPAGRVAITRPDKLLWPEEGISKGDLIEYYRSVAEWILPYLADRPLVLDRYPDGIGGESFFQKHAPHFAPGWLRRVTMPSDTAGRDIDYFVVEDVEGLVYMANAAAIPLHVWASRAGSPERPDWIVLDLDPKEAPFATVVRVAREIRRLCHAVGLPSYPKTSGRSGLHVLVPLGAQVEYGQARMLADLLALIVVRRLPDACTLERAVDRRGGRVYIDAVQNGAGRLLVVPYSARAVPGATVSTPLRWREVGPRLDPRRFTIRTVPGRLRRLRGEPMRGVLRDRPDLPAVLERLARLPEARAR